MEIKDLKDAFNISEAKTDDKDLYDRAVHKLENTMQHSNKNEKLVDKISNMDPKKLSPADIKILKSALGE